MHFESSILPLLQSLTARQQPSNQNTMNHYYIRAINGEVRLCLGSEGSPIQFRKLRVRELP